MLKWIFVPALVGALVVSPGASNAESDHYSPLLYRSRDGWRWNPDNGMWVNPKPRYDRDAKQWIHDTRLPSSTACCDSTGLWIPGDAGNDPDQPEASRNAQRRRDPRREAAQRRQEEAQRRAAEDAANTPRQGAAYGYTEDEIPARAQAALPPGIRPGQPYRPPGYVEPDMRSLPQEDSGAGSEDGGTGSSVFSGVGNFLSGAVEVAGALAPLAGAAAGVAAARNTSPSIPTTVRTTQPTQAQRPPTTYPNVPRYGQSDISGTR